VVSVSFVCRLALDERSVRFAAFAIALLIAPPIGAVAAESGAAPSDAEVEVDVGQNNVPISEAGHMCFFSALPSAGVKYSLVKKLKVGKGTYGSVTDILPKFAGYAQQVGADAIINYTGSQRFGFWPWRMVHPVVRGEAVKWSGNPGLDCAAMGGNTLDAILASNKAPPQ
jgi:hypothetical protein